MLSRCVELFRGRRPLAFVLRGGFWVLGLGLLSLTGVFERSITRPLIVLDAMLLRGSLGLLGVSTLRDGALVTDTGQGAFAIEVIEQCTGLSVFIILTALVLAWPASWRRRAAGLFAGAAVLFAVNHVRLVTLYLIGRGRPDLFHDVHHFVWQGVFLGLAMVYWYVWAWYAAAVPAGRSHADP